MMKKLYIFCLLLLLGTAAMAQDFKIVSVKYLERSMQAVDNKVTEQGSQGRDCALIRIATQNNITQEQQERFDFGTDMGSRVEKRANRDGEIWLWVTPGMRYLIIKGIGLGGSRELAFGDYGVTIQSLKTYKIVIRGTANNNGGSEKITTPTKQILAFEVTPKNAILEVNDEIWDVKDDGTANQYLDFGTYHYRVRAAKYFTKEGSVTLDNPDSTKRIVVALEPNFARVTLKVDADAEIWVNNEKKGTQTWNGILASGTYRIECKQLNHETSVVEQQITPDMDGQTIMLKSPKPICGSLKVESDPSIAKIYLDGKIIGKTPQFFSDVLIGSHELRIEKENYEPIIKEIVIEKGKTLELKNEKLSKAQKVTVETVNKKDDKDDKLGKLITIRTTPTGVMIEVDGKKVGISPVTIFLSNGSHKISAKRHLKYAYKQIEVQSSDEMNEHYLILESESARDYVDNGVGFVTLNVATSFTSYPQPSYGFSIGWVGEEVGLFFSAMSDFHFHAMKPSLTCDSEGLVDGEYPDYTGESINSRLSVMGGIILGNLICMRLGVGYGLRTRCLAISDGTLVKVADNSISGVDVTAGIQFNLKGFTISLDAVTTNFKTIEAKLGLGYCWK